MKALLGTHMNNATFAAAMDRSPDEAPEGHCPRCTAYETDVMARGEATNTAPCDDYEMSDRFRTWMVDRMRKEVMDQVQGAGLDRMALLKLDEEE